MEYTQPELQGAPAEIEALKYVGMQFGNVIILGVNPIRRNSQIQFDAYCEIHPELGVYQVLKGNIVSGNTRGCKKCAPMRAQQANIKHGLSDTHEYYTFNRIVDSITNPDSVFYCRYGGRGLTMDPRYDPKYKDQGKVAAFMNFINDLKELKLFPIPKGMTLDRKNNDIGYWKDNLRVVTQQVNNQNRECNVVTAEIVIKIREEYSRGGITQKALGEKYNCHKQVVWDIVNYKSWNNIK